MTPLLAAAVIVTYNVPVGGGGAEPFCHDLRAVMEAARANPPFSDFARADWPSFGFRAGCAVVAGGEAGEIGPVFSCGGPVVAEQAAAVANLDSRTARCLPPGSRRGRGAGMVRTTLFESRSVRVRIRDDGAAPGSGSGDSIRFTIARRAG